MLQQMTSPVSSGSGLFFIIGHKIISSLVLEVMSDFFLPST